MDSPMRKLGTLAQLVKKMLPVFLLNEAVSPKKNRMSRMKRHAVRVFLER